MLKPFTSVNTKSLNAGQNTLVSVIIGNYNYGRFIAQAIESVLNQTYRRFELIVVDDGSTDNSRDVIKSYQDKLIPIFQENAGQGAAFNAGLAKATGEIVCFLDSDDYFHPDKLAKVVAAFVDHPEWVQISHGRVSIDREGNIIGRDPTFFSQGDVRPLLLQWGRYAWAITSALSYRRYAIDQVAPLPKRPRAADTYLTATIPFYGEIGCIKEPLMFYRKHGKNRRGQTNNIPYLIEQREDTAQCINKAAVAVGINQRFDLNRDSDYLSFKAIEQGGVSWTKVLQIIWFTLQETLAIGHPLKDTIERLMRRGICSLSPAEGMVFLRFGPSRYLRFKLTGKQPKNYELSGKIN
ncbi:MAG: glycosyltransferase [Moorea sp. SIO1G6]|uniref:glycosyltransferase family 2 protein n=1 Tax=Moorena sp. SIO1G6 TaxID=2607840 RepID=UPI0013C11F77|nr:glycosyltransferase [Moorena sp. SIO1G6]NET62924.1 glycosyltransferase [Moorena sp. SIO1G6]